jgi:hypothetical protein
MDVHLHQRLLIPPALPPTRGNGHVVMAMALCPALKVVATDERQVLAHNLHYKEAPEQPY